MTESITELREERKAASALFADRKARLTYYIITLPFAFFGGAISSYRPTDDAQAFQIAIEVISWSLFLFSGCIGLLAKHGEMEIARLRSLSLNNKVADFESRNRNIPFSAEEHAYHRQTSAKTVNAEYLESTFIVCISLFLIACFGLMASRMLLAII